MQAIEGCHVTYMKRVKVAEEGEGGLVYGALSWTRRGGVGGKGAGGEEWGGGGRRGGGWPEHTRSMSETGGMVRVQGGEGEGGRT
jgi:hypothetical protein